MEVATLEGLTAADVRELQREVAELKRQLAIATAAKPDGGGVMSGSDDMILDTALDSP